MEVQYSIMIGSMICVALVETHVTEKEEQRMAGNKRNLFSIDVCHDLINMS